MLFAVGTFIHAAEATNIKFQSPSGTQYFSAKPAIYNSPLAELLALGSGTINFSVKVQFTVKTATGTSTSGAEFLGFSKGIIYPDHPNFPHSGTKISVTTDGWLILQRGKEIQMVPTSSITAITGTIPDQIEQVADGKPPEAPQTPH